jgi:hypothetical protein
MISTTLVIALPRLNLHTILQFRTLGSTILNNIREELISKELLLSNIMDFQFDYSHYIMISALFLFLYGQYKYTEGQRSVNEKIEKIQMFGTIKQITNELLFVFLIVFTKNVEEVF